MAVAVQILAATGPALAERDSYLAVSLGRAAADFSMDTVIGNVDTGWSAGGKALQLALGRPILDNVVLEAAYGVWRRPLSSADATVTQTIDDVDRYVGVGSVTANIYSDMFRLEDLALRLGLGFGKGYVADAGTSVEEYGVLALVGVQHEWSLDDDFAVGVRADYGFFGGRPALGGSVFFASVFARLSFLKHLSH